MKQAGFRTFVVTNQSGIGRGLITEAQYRAVQEELLRQIGDRAIDASYFCPDAPGVPSARRKPEPGMVLEAAADFDLDLARSWFIGDKSADIECGRRAGAADHPGADRLRRRSRTASRTFGRRTSWRPSESCCGDRPHQSPATCRYMCQEARYAWRSDHYHSHNVLAVLLLKTRAVAPVSTFTAVKTCLSCRSAARADIAQW